MSKKDLNFYIIIWDPFGGNNKNLYCEAPDVGHAMTQLWTFFDENSGSCEEQEDNYKQFVDLLWEGVDVIEILRDKILLWTLCKKKDPNAIEWLDNVYMNHKILKERK